MKRVSPNDPVLYYVPMEETLAVVQQAHAATGHGGRDRMIKELDKKYKNIPREALKFFIGNCSVCQQKAVRQRTKGVVVKPILTKDFMSRAQIDLIDFQSMADGNFKWLLVFQDHLTKFCVLRPLTSKRASEVAIHLVDIFCLFGAPVILQSDNGSEFTAGIIRELKSLWPTLHLVNGKPRHPQSQGSVERANADIKNMLSAWMQENSSKRWTMGIRFVQFMKNTSHHGGIKRAPYKAMFGTDAKVGLASSSLPREVIERLETEVDLITVFQNLEVRSSSEPESSVTESQGILQEQQVTVTTHVEAEGNISFGLAPAETSSSQPQPVGSSLCGVVSGEAGPSQSQDTSEDISQGVVWVDDQGILVTQSGPVTVVPSEVDSCKSVQVDGHATRALQINVQPSQSTPPSASSDPVEGHRPSQNVLISTTTRFIWTS